MQAQVKSIGMIQSLSLLRCIKESSFYIHYFTEKLI